jgi:hypothetical protein
VNHRLESTPGRHPHFDDRGATTWHLTLATALEEAKKSGKKVFVEFGREA